MIDEYILFQPGKSYKQTRVWNWRSFYAKKSSAHSWRRMNKNFLWERRRSSRQTSGLSVESMRITKWRQFFYSSRNSWKSAVWLTLFFNTKLRSTGLRITAGAIKARISLKHTAEVFEKNSRIFFGQAWLILWQGRCLLRPLFCYCLNLWYFHRSSKLGV